MYELMMLQTRIVALAKTRGLLPHKAVGTVAGPSSATPTQQANQARPPAQSPLVAPNQIQRQGKRNSTSPGEDVRNNTTLVVTFALTGGLG